MSFFKNLIFADSENSNPTTPSKEESVKVVEVVNTTPVNIPTTPQMPQTTPLASTVNVNQEHLNKAIELYEKGFDSLNQDGFDFYEFFQSVSQGGINNPQIYTMAYAMGMAMDKTISKDKLMNQADFYVTEITKVYDDYVLRGNEKKEVLLKQKESENQTLTNELTMFQQQLEALQIQIADRQTKLQAINGKYQPQLDEVESKLNANTIAKNKVVEAIQTVKTGINVNIK